MRFGELRHLQEELDFGLSLDLKDDEVISQLQSVLDSLCVPEHPLDYFYSDLVNSSDEAENFFNQLLKSDYYESAIANAEQCISISRKCRDVAPRKAEHWIKSLLKAWDPVIICYAQEVKKLKLIQPGTRHSERQVYAAVKPISNSLMEFANAMEDIYKMRNMLTHQQYHQEKENKIKFKKLPARRLQHYLETTVSLMEQKLPAFIDEYRKEHAAVQDKA